VAYEQGKHPIMISIRRNHQEHCWEVMLQAGGFNDESQAKKYAKVIKEFLEDEANGEIGEAH
jgi:hypothetical protein